MNILQTVESIRKKKLRWRNSGNSIKNKSGSVRWRNLTRQKVETKPDTAETLHGNWKHPRRRKIRKHVYSLFTLRVPLPFGTKGIMLTFVCYGKKHRSNSSTIFQKIS